MATGRHKPRLDATLLYRVAKMYYLDGMNQNEIGAVENLSRSQISRLLDQARAQGIVRIEVKLPEEIDRDILGGALKRELGLKAVVLAPSCDRAGGEGAVTEAIATAAAAFLPRELRSCTTVGVGWGRTMYHMSCNLSYAAAETETTFVPLVGASGTDNPYLQINTIIDRMAEKQRGHNYFSNIPVFRDSSVPFTYLESQRIRRLNQYWGQLDAAVFGLGAKVSSNSFFAGEVSEEYVEHVQQSEVLGDILSQFFYADGGIFDLGGAYRQTAFDIKRLRGVPRTICLAGGAEKADAILAAARAGFFNLLVTDPATARLIYDKTRSDSTQ